jgi:energy-coupling factor transporter ATP-binding protein EcfA2
MSFQIANVLIWQKNGILRNLEFEKNKVNVITGDSGKGKSSILYIIDYCLLASSAKGISKENIDNKSEWYGVRLWTSKGLITIARPAFHRNLKKVYFHRHGEIPEHPVANMAQDSLKRILDGELGIDSNIVVPYGGDTIRPGSRITYRSFMPFCYQDQNTLVAPSYLYIRPNDKQLSERIERTFKMVVGILNAEGSIVDERLERLNAMRDRLIKNKNIYKTRKYEFEDELFEMAEEAVELGLMENSSYEPKEALTNLRELAKAPFERFTRGNEELINLEREEFSLTTKLKRFIDFTKEYNEYQKSLKQSDESIQCIEYLRSNYEELIPSGSTLKLLEVLESELIEIKSGWKLSGESVLYQDVKEQERKTRESLHHIRQKISEVKSNISETSSPEKIYKYQGKLEAKVDLYSIETTSEDNDDRLIEIENQISELTGKVNERESKRDYIMMALNDKINEHLEALKLKGYENSKAVFVENLKTVNLILDEGRAVEKMEDIGSASNYLYVHLAYFMALHETARRYSDLSLPSFLILDQVSTPYSNETPDDIKSLDIALAEINQFVSDMDNKGGIQVILMEHIRESHWKSLNLDKFKLVDRELRGDYGLIL